MNDRYTRFEENLSALKLTKKPPPYSLPVETLMLKPMFYSAIYRRLPGGSLFLGSNSVRVLLMEDCLRGILNQTCHLKGQMGGGSINGIALSIPLPESPNQESCMKEVTLKYEYGKDHFNCEDLRPLCCHPIGFLFIIPVAAKGYAVFHATSRDIRKGRISFSHKLKDTYSNQLLLSEPITVPEGESIFEKWVFTIKETKSLVSTGLHLVPTHSSDLVFKIG